MTTPYPIPAFGGLDAYTDPTDVGAGGAVDMLNVDFDKRGAVRCRDGMTLFNSFAQTSASTNPFFEVWGIPDGKVIGASGTTVYGMSSAGASLASTTPFTASGGFTNQGDSGGSYTLVASATGANMKIWQTSAWLGTAFTGTAPTGKWVGTTPWDNRCVMCGYGSSSRVQFSTEFAPFDWPTTQWVDLGLNDSETFDWPIVEWGGQTYIFKRSHYYVFYGTSTLSNGSPDFKFNGYRTPFGNGKLYAVVSAADGVYCLASQGLYRIQQGSAVLVSRAVNPLLQGTAPSPLPYLAPTIHAAAIGERVYFSCATNAASTSPSYVLAWDGALGTWLLWSANHSTIASGADTRFPRLYVSERGTATQPIDYMDPAVSTDNGVAIPWSYTSGLYSPVDDPGRIAITLESQLVGSGTVNLQVATTGGAGSSSGAFDTAAAVTLGTSPTVAEGWDQRDREGAYFQHKLSGTGTGVVDRLVHFVRFVKPAGVW